MTKKPFLILLLFIVLLFITYHLHQSLIFAYYTPAQQKNEFKQQIKTDLANYPPLNLAFFGLDKTKERVSTMGSFRTDTIVVMRLDFSECKIDMLAIPRDTYVFLPVINDMDKINHAFSYGGGEARQGFESSIAAIENFLGINIDHYIGMDMEAIEPIVDALNGIEMEVDLNFQEDGCHLVKGKKQTLDGHMAYHYVCYRYTENGDIDRIARQQKFLQTFITQSTQKLSLEKSLQIYEKFRTMTYTDMTLPQLITLGYYFKSLTSGEINSLLLSGTFMNINGISYWEPDLQQQKTLIDSIFKE